MTREEVFEWVRGEFGVEPLHKWPRYPRYAVLQRGKKWFGAVIDVPKSKFGLDSDEVIDVLNVKAERMTIDMLVERPGLYRAYHMNKMHWISVFLDGTVQDHIIKSLIAGSYDMVSGVRRRKAR